MKTFNKPFLYLSMILLIFCSCSSDDNSQDDSEENILITTVTDIDGNVYETIVIGNQTWMVENLKTTSLNDGTPITEYTFAEFGNDWNLDNQMFPFYQWADTSDLNNIFDEDLPFDYYGALYNEAALSSGKLAPNGWRIPSEADFIELKNYLSSEGYTDNEGTALKSTSGWSNFSGNGTDIYGFNALANGYSTNLGSATGAGVISTLATSNINQTDQTRRVLNLLEETMEFADNSILLGSGVRCLKN
ncbi:fibrobacter succinogenes major paralogous domain-containing protein [Psychroserpens sp.]|uniref:fibrobacter succinogenes major paralogous domain-containing protein n=1 Tax=Psychroserpens sp. TaxID=2020870 RepID=UPI0038588015